MERAGGSTARPAPWAEVQGTRARAVAALPARWSVPTPPRGLPRRNPSACPPPRAANSPDGARIARRAPGERAARGNNSSQQKRARRCGGRRAARARPLGGAGAHLQRLLDRDGRLRRHRGRRPRTALQAWARSVKSKVRLVSRLVLPQVPLITLACPGAPARAPHQTLNAQIAHSQCQAHARAPSAFRGPGVPQTTLGPPRVPGMRHEVTISRSHAESSSVRGAQAQARGWRCKPPPAPWRSLRPGGRLQRRGGALGCQWRLRGVWRPLSAH